jgi:hypothetical protein
MQMHVKELLEINFIYLGNKETDRIFKTYCIIFVLFSTKYRLFHNFIFSVHVINTFCINHVLKFKYQPGCLKIKAVRE